MEEEMTVDVLALWESVLDEIRNGVNPETFERWFGQCAAARLQGDRLVVEVPNIFVRNWIIDHYGDAIARALSKHVPSKPPRLELSINEALERSEAPQPANGNGSARNAGQNAQAPLNGTNGNGFNPKYTFDNFVEGNCNRFARAGCMAVAQAPARAYNPLFIYGGTGLGKTHLMHAIGQYMLVRNPLARVMYTSSEYFTNHLITSLQNRSMEQFRHHYRTMRALLIDDIQFLCGKEQTQEEFFHTFNSLFDAGSQIIVSSDRPPADLNQMEQRLISRFEWGLVVDLQLPDFETRVAIIRKKAECEGINIADDIAYFLADRIRSNVRQLEGALIRVASYASLMALTISEAVCNHVLEDILVAEQRHEISLDEIQRRVAEHFDIRVADMKSSRRPKSIAFPRQIAMYLSRELTDCTLQEIGEAFGGKDHSTIIHGCRLVKNRFEEDAKLRLTIASLSKSLQQ
jgi:chromosomal replication initiator protein